MKRVDGLPVRMGELRVQVDRWPTTENPEHPYVLTIITVCMYDKKPDHKTIVKAVSDSLEILKATP